MGRLEGRVAFITGAARLRGIGRATALRLAAEGADVAVCGLKRAPSDLPKGEQEVGWRGVESVAEEIRAMSRRAVGLDCDVTDGAQVEAAFEAATSELGIPTAVVNNAGMSGSAGLAPIATLSEEDWRKVLDVNLTGVFLVAKAGAARMLAAGAEGGIVNVASIAARIPFANFGAYCAAKFGVIGLTQQMALELADQKIRVNCLCPGGTDTDMVTNSFTRTSKAMNVEIDAIYADVAARVPMKRISSPDEQAAVIAFLLSDDSSYMTGQSLNANGGMRMD